MSSAKQKNSLTPAMPGLDTICKILDISSKKPLRDFTLIVAQHLLPTTIPLFEKFVEAGVNPAQMFILGKTYSTTPWVEAYLRKLGCKVRICQRTQIGLYEFDLDKEAHSLWKALTNQHKSDRTRPILIIDHGGFLRKHIPKAYYSEIPMASVEHTSKGFFSNLRNLVPVVDMARSRMKIEQEPRIIIEQSLSKLRRLKIPFEKMKIGIIGAGVIGEALANKLLYLNCSVSIFDINFKVTRALRSQSRKVVTHSNVRDLINNSDLIFGCTGRDSCAGVNWSKISGTKILASVSSGDIEFSSVLRTGKFYKKTMKNGSRVSIGSCNVTILEGGFPINFDPLSEHGHTSDIDLTRSLTFLSALQAAQIVRSNLVLPFSDDFQSLLEKIAWQV